LRRLITEGCANLRTRRVARPPSNVLFTEASLRLRHSGPRILSQINSALTPQMLFQCVDGSPHHLSLVPPRELKEAPAPPTGASDFCGKVRACNDPVTARTHHRVLECPTVPFREYSSHFPTSQLDAFTAAYDAAWNELLDRGTTPDQAAVLKKNLAQIILASACKVERDVERLKAIALRALG